MKPTSAQKRWANKAASQPDELGQLMERVRRPIEMAKPWGPRGQRRLRAWLERQVELGVLQPESLDYLRELWAAQEAGAKQ